MHLHIWRSSLYGLPAGCKGRGCKGAKPKKVCPIQRKILRNTLVPMASPCLTRSIVQSSSHQYLFTHWSQHCTKRWNMFILFIYFLHGQDWWEHIAGAIASTNHAAKPQVFRFRAADYPGGAVSRWPKFSHDQLCSGPNPVLQKACHIHITFWQQSERVSLPRQWFGVFILVADSRLYNSCLLMQWSHTVPVNRLGHTCRFPPFQAGTYLVPMPQHM